MQFVHSRLKKEKNKMTIGSVTTMAAEGVVWTVGYPWDHTVNRLECIISYVGEDCVEIARACTDIMVQIVLMGAVMTRMTIIWCTNVYRRISSR